MVRSVGRWSAGVRHTERSILNAYIDLIRKSEHYIYIEVRHFNFFSKILILKISFSRLKTLKTLLFHSFRISFSLRQRTEKKTTK